MLPLKHNYFPPETCCITFITPDTFSLPHQWFMLQYILPSSSTVYIFLSSNMSLEPACVFLGYKHSSILPCNNFLFITVCISLPESVPSIWPKYIFCFSYIMLQVCLFPFTIAVIKTPHLTTAATHLAHFFC